MLTGKIHDLRHFGLSHLICIDPTFAHTVIVNMKHDVGRGLPVLLEKALKHVNDKLHGSVVIIEQQNAIETRLFRLRFRSRYDCGSTFGSAIIVVVVATLHRNCVPLVWSHADRKGLARLVSVTDPYVGSLLLILSPNAHCAQVDSPEHNPARANREG